MEHYNFGQRGTMIETDEPKLPIFVAMTGGELVMARDSGLVKMSPMLGHIIANTIDGFARAGLLVGDVTCEGVTAYLMREAESFKLSVGGGEVKFPAFTAPEVVNAIEEIIPTDALHWLAPGQIPGFLQPENGITPALPGQAPAFQPSPASLLVLGDNFCGCEGGLSSLSKCSPRCKNCLAVPAYKNELDQFNKYGGELRFFREHPFCYKF